MGCDIHMYVEIKTESGWESGDYFRVSYPLAKKPELQLVELYGYRNYALFAVLANVRNRGYNYIDSPRGIPDDATNFVKSEYEDWRYDAHSASYFTLRELIDYHEEHKPRYDDFRNDYILTPLIEKMKERAHDLYFIHDFQWNGDGRKEAMKRANDIRIVFWFDN